jgi:hypothetical protein
MGFRSTPELRPLKLSQSGGSLHEFENRRSEPVGERILIGTLAHPPVRHKIGHWLYDNGNVRSAISTTGRQKR